MSIFKEAYLDCKEAKKFDEIQFTKKSYRRPQNWMNEKDDWEKFESETKDLLITLGATHINLGKFEFDLSEVSNSPKPSRQIDAIGLVNNRFLLICECKHSSNSRSRAVEGAFNTIEANKAHIKQRLKKILNIDFQPIWIMSTNGIDISQEKKLKYLQNDVITITEFEKEYLEDCCATSSSKEFTYNQFLGLFKNNASYYEKKEYGVLETVIDKRNKKNAYTFAIPANEMIPISYVSHKRAEGIYSDTNGNYQRVLTKQRIKNIAAHIDNSKQPFTNNILVSYRGKKGKFKLKETDIGQGRTKILEFPPNPGTFHIIDGQHRLFSYCEVENKGLRNQTLLVTAFKDLTEEEEARIFLDVNQKQKKVDAGLLLEVQLIFGEASTGDEQIINLATSILLNLREDSDSPFTAGMIPKAEKRGTLPLKTMNKELTKGNLLGRDKNFTKGMLCVEDNFRSTVDFSTKLLKNYFGKIEQAIPNYWKMTVTGQPSAIRMNFIGGLISVLRRMIVVSFGDEQINYKKIDSYIAGYIDHLCANLKKINDEQIALHFLWKINGVKLTEGGPKMPLARSYIIRDFLMDLPGNLKPLWNIDDEKIINAEDPEKNREENEIEAVKAPLIEKINELKAQLKMSGANVSKEREAIIIERIIRRYIHQILKNSFDSTFDNEQETYWDNLKIHRLSFSTDPKASNCHPYIFADNNSTIMKQRWHEKEIFKPYKYLLSHCNYLQLLKILKIIREKYPDIWNEISNGFEIEDFESNEKNQQSKKDDKIEGWMMFLNELRNYGADSDGSGGAHSGLDEDVKPSGTDRADEVFKYYKKELQKKFKILDKLIK
tara:strand:- start:392 stop:2884 length:2493 start_codon:yes stop_codon:yes gene_type:complete